MDKQTTLTINIPAGWRATIDNTADTTEISLLQVDADVLHPSRHREVSAGNDGELNTASIPKCDFV